VQRYLLYHSDSKLFAIPETNANLVSILKQRHFDQYTPKLQLVRIRVTIRAFVDNMHHFAEETLAESGTILLPVPEPILGVAMGPRQPILVSLNHCIQSGH